MKNFLISISVFIIIITSVYFLVSKIVEPKKSVSNDYLAAIIDKHNRLSQINRPKIIFAGGSNLAFGLNSEEIQKEFSVPVVNLGLNASLGLDFILSELEHTIKSNDVVFLSIEYFLTSLGNYEFKINAKKQYNEASEYFDIDLRDALLIHLDKTRLNIQTYNNAKSEINRKKEVQIYSRNSFNKYGDAIVHLDMTPPIKLVDRSVILYEYWEGINRLNEFYNYAKSKNVAVYFIYPNYPTSEYVKNKLAISKLSVDLEINLQMEILNTPTDFVYPDSLFFDTIYHLNKKGREMRTNKLIELIKKNTNAQQRLNAIRVSEVIEH